VPVDGRLLALGVFDESALSGEAMPVERPAGDDVRSGVVSLAQPVDLVATALAAESTYAGVVRLVEQAQASTAPFVRSADRFAVAFVPLTLTVAGLAWLRQEPSGNPSRASGGLSLGGRLRGDVQVTQGVGVFLLADARGLGVRLATSDGTRPGVKGLFTVTAGLRAAF